MSIWEHYKEILLDPAHTLVESTFVLAEFIIFSVIAVRLKKAWAKMLDLWHRRLDEEHGHKHIKTHDEIVYDVLHPEITRKRSPLWYKGDHRSVMTNDVDPGWLLDALGGDWTTSDDEKKSSPQD